MRAKTLGVDDVVVGLAARAMQGEDVALRDQLIEGHVARVELLLDLGRRAERVVIDDLDLEALQALGDVLADIAEAEDADRLAGQLAAQRAQLGVDPLAFAHRAVGQRQAAQRGQGSADRVLGDRRRHWSRR